MGEEDGQRAVLATDETRARLLEAAAQLFAERGYARTTTRDLAAAAGVNEVTLFRHFGSKKNLFAAAVEHYASPSLDAALEMRPGADYRRNLMVMGRQVLDLLLERRDLMRLMLCEAEHFPEVGEALAQNPRRLRRALASYLQFEMERGEVRQLHPEAAAQAFWGMFFAYSVSLGLLVEQMSPELSTDEVVERFVDIFVLGTKIRG
ncbi:MAG: TetR/AcrR family transcriptional regulator [Anaerolineae bacterium]|jgi:AcrR family transcriptional regulator